MADLIAIGYPDETTALAAMDEANRLSRELVIQPDAIAAIVRDKEGKLRVTTNHHPVGAGASWGMMLKSSLSKDAEHQLQEALHGQQATV